MDDLKIFLNTLQLWNNTLPTLYIYCTSTIHIPEYKGVVHKKACLDIYSSLSRGKMEQMPSRQGLANLFHDFTVEKCSLMEWAIQEHKDGVLFCDADICWLGPLPSIPKGTVVALSPHEIRHADEKKYGTYNAGFLYISSLEVTETWLKESLISDFFEQLSLDEVAKLYPTYIFGTHINYGWWRMFQGPVSPEERKNDWSIHKNEAYSGLYVKGIPVVCIHTHWKTNDFITKMFNMWILDKLQNLKKQKKVASLIRCLS
jgi:hypothetical protein